MSKVDMVVYYTTCYFLCISLWNAPFLSDTQLRGHAVIMVVSILLQNWLCVSYFPQTIVCRAGFFQNKEAFEAGLLVQPLATQCFTDRAVRGGLENKACFLYLGVCIRIAFWWEPSRGCTVLANRAKGYGNALHDSFSFPMDFTLQALNM